jgi:hypothetical protein
MILEWAVPLTLVGDALLIGLFLWLRFAMTSLNRDVQAMLDRQATIRARLAVLEAMNQIGHHVDVAKEEH